MITLRRTALFIAATLALPLASCSLLPGSSEPVTSTVIVTPSADQDSAENKDKNKATATGEESTKKGKEPAKESSPYAQLAAGYKKAIANPDAISMNSVEDYYPTGIYWYGFTDVNGDGTPEMLYKKESKGWGPVSVFHSSDNGKTVQNTQDVLLAGASTAGGSRQDVSGSASGSGLWEVAWHSVQNEAVARRYELNGNKLQSVGEEISFTKMVNTPPDVQPIAWFRTTDTTGFDTLAEGDIPTQSNNMSRLGESTSGVGDPNPGVAARTDTTSFSGTVRRKTAAEVMNGQPTPNGEPEDQVFWVLELDTPQNVTASIPHDVATRFISEIALGEKTEHQDDSSQWEKLENKHVTVTAETKRVHYPSDSSMPMGMLRLGPGVSAKAS